MRRLNEGSYATHANGVVMDDAIAAAPSIHQETCIARARSASIRSWIFNYVCEICIASGDNIGNVCWYKGVDFMRSLPATGNAITDALVRCANCKRNMGGHRGEEEGPASYVGVGVYEWGAMVY